ncbi:5'-methylthioadenosine/adenosylhomocysteine nucleosidase [Halobacillus salinarum]|uniref:adenosylhomocysteine nucleosidase n=1 Tax=Halobacillus salinarum TaxID=2932257 RepID=A0ABY4EUZ5_9BACI|nr:5'-methylthioadenosine/adenosylhomocysteine nucleosidase [Halobacillus salinarum]UOQ45971.1 5'-methylthioadenosine/adenosylhomocysteine nucleosidase [Halobacillus salinarum]
MPIGILGALEQEISYFLARMDIWRKQEIAKHNFYYGELENERIVLCQTGVGKVNAASISQILIDLYKVKAIIFTGTAGALDPDLNIGDIIVSTDVIQFDVDFSPIGFPLGMIPYLKRSAYVANPHLVKLALNTATKFPEQKVVKGRILTGDQFVTTNRVAEEIRKTFKGVSVEAEGAAVGQVCYLNNIPFVIIRAISDRANMKAPSDFTTIAEEVAKPAQMVVVSIIKRLNELKRKKKHLK